MGTWIFALERGLEPLGQRPIGRMVAEKPAPHSKHRVGVRHPCTSRMVSDWRRSVSGHERNSQPPEPCPTRSDLRIGSLAPGDARLTDTYSLPQPHNRA